MAWLEQELRRYPLTQSVLTSRPSARELVKQMTVLEITAWTPTQVEQFVRRRVFSPMRKPILILGGDAKQRAAGQAVLFYRASTATPLSLILPSTRCF